MRLCLLLLSATFYLTSQSLYAEKIGEIWDTKRIQNRIESRDYSYFAFGPASFSHMGSDGSGVGLSYGHIWETTTWAAIQGSIDGAAQFGDTASSIISGTLGANFYLTATEASPFIGAGLGYAIAATDADDIDNTAGWAGNISLGLALFRTSSTQLHLTIRYLQIFADNGEGRPSQSTLGLGVAF